MLEKGIPVCLGNDGFSNAMWEEWKAAYLAHKLYHRDPRKVQGDTVARMAACAGLPERTFTRKLKEIFRSLWLELRYSKDEILWKSFEGHHYVLYGIGILTAFVGAPFFLYLIMRQEKTL